MILEAEKSITFGDYSRALKEIEYANTKVPFFKTRNSSLPAFDGNITQLPITTKSDYRKNFPTNILAEGHTLESPFINRLQSSGTSGERLITVSHTFKIVDRFVNTISMSKHLKHLADAKKIKTCRYAAPNCSDVECSNPNATREDRMLEDGTLVLPAYHDLLTTPKTMLRTCFDELHEYEANIWFVDPMYLAFLSRKAKEYGWEFDLRAPPTLLLSYAFCTQSTRRQIDDFSKLASPVSNVIAMSEFGYVGAECESGIMHLNSKDYFLEFIPFKDGKNENQLYELVMTSIGDRLSPHIRYQTNDIYRLIHEPSTQPSDNPAVIFQGRSKDIIEIDDGKLVTPRQVDDALGAPLWIDVYQLNVVSKNHYTIKYDGDKNLFSTEEQNIILDKLKSLLKTETITFEHAKYFPFERGGKFSLIRKAI
jgi:phenylacetate-coenzyme A ligase PaaK-like adenylate-forming protein